MKKKVLMVCEAFGGGVFAYVSQLCNDMCQEFEVYLAYTIRPQTPTNYMESLDKRIKLIELKNMSSSLCNPVSVIKAVKELQKIGNMIKPDLIHLHSSIAGGIGRLAYNGKDCPLVYTPHGYAHILMGDPFSVKCKVYYWMEKLLGLRHCITLTCCESENEEASKLTKRTSFVETGVNLKDLNNKLQDIIPIKNKRFTVYTLGRTCVQKQPQLFNRIAELVPEVDFVWIGGGELDSLLTAKNIKLTGWKPRHEALAMGKGADMYILCSKGEAIAMSLIENMYMKKVCMVSNVMGNKSVIKNGVNGYVCTTPEDYADCIRKAINEFPQKLAEHAYQDVLTCYNTKSMSEKYTKFYYDAIKGEYK